MTQVQYRRTGLVHTSSWNTLRVTNGSNLDICGLESASEYIVRIAAINGAGSGTESVTTFWTPLGVVNLNVSSRYITTDTAVVDVDIHKLSADFAPTSQIYILKRSVVNSSSSSAGSSNELCRRMRTLLPANIADSAYKLIRVIPMQVFDGTFVLGDESVYDGCTNEKLQPGAQYQVLVLLKTKLQNESRWYQQQLLLRTEDIQLTTVSIEVRVCSFSPFFQYPTFSETDLRH